jgi:hypothetical protein
VFRHRVRSSRARDRRGRGRAGPAVRGWGTGLARVRARDEEEIGVRSRPGPDRQDRREGVGTGGPQARADTPSRGRTRSPMDNGPRRRVRWMSDQSGASDRSVSCDSNAVVSSVAPGCAEHESKEAT